MESKSGSFRSNRKAIRDLKEQLTLIREENWKLKNSSSIGDKNNKMTNKVILRNKIVLLFRAIVNYFTSSSKRAMMLSKEIESIKKENAALRLKELQAYEKMARLLRQSASFHSQGSVDRAMR